MEHDNLCKHRHNLVSTYWHIVRVQVIEIGQWSPISLCLYHFSRYPTTECIGRAYTAERVPCVAFEAQLQQCGLQHFYKLSSWQWREHAPTHDRQYGMTWGWGPRKLPGAEQSCGCTERFVFIPWQCNEWSSLIALNGLWIWETHNYSLS